MRKLAIGIATLWLLAVALIGFAALMPAHAATIPSSSSGVYLAPQRTCRLVWQRYQVHWIQLDMRCLNHVDGTQSYLLSTLYAPGGACPTSDIAWTIDPRMTLAVHEYISIRAVLPDRLQVVLGTDSSAVSNGIGVAQEWLLVESLGSPAPYTCGAAPRFRVFGR